jgi:predicted nucleic acid-binding Zn ribbon protein
MSRAAPRSLSTALEQLASTLAPATTLARVQAAWESVVGAAITAAARPSTERDGVATVLCESSVWAHELELMAVDLIARLNDELGQPTIRELRCRVG